MEPLYHRVNSDQSLTPIKLGIVTASGLDTGDGAHWGQPIHLRIHEASVLGMYAESIDVYLRLHEARVEGRSAN